jgi:AcrR family transcriptional regulator
MTDGFTRRKEHSKEDIRKAAWELFSQFGVEKVSVADIARTAGVSQATIYNNFGSKEALVKEFITTVIDQLVQGVQAVLAPNQPFWQKMAAFIQFIAGMVAEGRAAEMAPAVFSSNHNLLQDPDIQKIHAAAQEKMTGLLLGLVQEGKQQGQIRPDLSDDAFRVYFRAFMDIFTDQQFRLGYLKDPKLAQDLGALLLFGMSGQPK